MQPCTGGTQQKLEEWEGGQSVRDLQRGGGVPAGSLKATRIY